MDKKKLFLHYLDHYLLDVLNKIKNLVLKISKIKRIRNKKYKVNKLYM